MPSDSVLFSRALPTEKSLFPLAQGISSWTTFAGIPKALPLNNATLNPQRVAKDLPLTFEKAPDGKEGLKLHYPQGSYKLSADPRGGISFYSTGPANFSLDTAREATFGYSVYFPADLDFVKGGKLPGFFGGDSEEVSYTCSGGRQDTVCFSSRLMWRTSGEGEIYSYFPPYNTTGNEANQALCTTPKNVCDETYGISIGRGNFTFPTGAWTTVSQRLRLNDAGQANGQAELFVDGTSVINATGIIIRDSDAGRIRGIQVQSFFGGSTVDWATPKDQDIYLADFSFAVIEDFSGRRKSGSTGRQAMLGWMKTPSSLVLAASVLLGVLSSC